MLIKVSKNMRNTPKTSELVKTNAPIFWIIIFEAKLKNQPLQLKQINILRFWRSWLIFFMVVSRLFYTSQLVLHLMLLNILYDIVVYLTLLASNWSFLLCFIIVWTKPKMVSVYEQISKERIKLCYSHNFFAFWHIFFFLEKTRLTNFKKNLQLDWWNWCFNLIGG